MAALILATGAWLRTHLSSDLGHSCLATYLSNGSSDLGHSCLATYLSYGSSDLGHSCSLGWWYGWFALRSCKLKVPQ